MNLQEALLVFGSLSQETRLRTFRFLAEAGHDGIPAGTLSQKLGIPANTLSFHLSCLEQSGIIQSTRKGRSIIYQANFDIVCDLIRFLVENCCAVEFASIHENKKKEKSIIDISLPTH